MSSSCPYCNSAKSLLLGHVYCSHQGTSMQRLETGTLFIKAKKMEETADHVSRLSIRMMLNGRQHYKLGDHDHLVTTDNYLLVNQGQQYRTSFQGVQDQEMLLVAFQPGFAEGLLHAHITPEDALLDDPFHQETASIQFFQKTYPRDPVLHNLFSILRGLMDKDLSERREADLDSIYSALLVRMLEVHRGLGSEMARLGSVKSSTRKELFRRLSIARDYLDAHTGRRLSVEEVAQTACLSVHHFKRAFKDLTGMSPHRYHVLRRLEYARQYIHQGIMPIGEIGRAVGFEDCSSFIRLYRQYYGSTPGAGKPDA
jgi:AraC family transcriptional regulator